MLPELRLDHDTAGCSGLKHVTVSDIRQEADFIWAGCLEICHAGNIKLTIAGKLSV